MYISHTHKIVFIALPKNASRTVGVWLKQNYEAEVDDHHSIVPAEPEKIKDYFPFAVVRNPYSRCVSRWYGWYQFMALDPEDLQFKQTLQPSFEAYLAGLKRWHTASKRIEPDNALYHACQIHILDKAQSLFVQKIKLLRFEKLHEELSVLPFVKGDVTLPRRGIRNNVYGEWQRYYEKPWTRRKVSNAYRADFERLEYPADVSHG